MSSACIPSGLVKSTLVRLHLVRDGVWAHLALTGPRFGYCGDIDWELGCIAPQ